MLSWIRLCPRWTQPFEFCPIRAQLFHRCQLADQVAAVLVRREVVHRLVLKAGTLLELRAVVRVLRAVRAQHQRELALAAVHPVAVGLAAGVAVGGIALDSVSLSSPSSLLRMGLMSIASAARMTVISEQVDATVDRFIGILSFRRQKAALSFLTKRLQRDIFKTCKSGARVRCLSLPHNDFVS